MLMDFWMGYLNCIFHISLQALHIQLLLLVMRLVSANVPSMVVWSHLELLSLLFRKGFNI